MINFSTAPFGRLGWYYLEEVSVLEDFTEILRSVETGGLDIKTTHATALLLKEAFPKASERRVLELGSGTGVVSVAIAKMYKRQVTGIELQCELVDVARKLAELNSVEDKVGFLCADVKDIKDVVRAESFDMVISNPPHFSRKIESLNVKRRLERSINGESMEGFVKAIFWSLKNGGEYVLVLGVENFMDWLWLLRKMRLEPKLMRFFHPKNKAELVAIRGRKNARPGLIVEMPYIGGSL